MSLTQTEILVLMLTFSPYKACLPITRPIFHKMMSSSIFGSRCSSSSTNPLSGLTSSKGIKLHNTTRTNPLDDDSSERQLAEPEDGLSGKTHFESYAERGSHNNTIISCADKVPNSNADPPTTCSIQVKKETKVYYESI
jgi:hypothetical protein